MTEKTFGTRTWCLCIKRSKHICGLNCKFITGKNCFCGSSINDDGTCITWRKAFYDNLHKEVNQMMELEFPVVKWNEGEKYAVLHNKSDKPISTTGYANDYCLKDIEFLREFDNANEALDYQYYLFDGQYGDGLDMTGEYERLEKKFGKIKDKNEDLK